jgi:type I pantothenate kinase
MEEMGRHRRKANQERESPRADQDLTRVLHLVETLAPAAGPVVIGVTGAVAVGKSTFAARLSRAITTDGRRVDLAATDGFLFPNAVLEARGLAMRKGFPESYDVDALAAALRAIRAGPTIFPGYSHQRYDIDRTLSRRIGPVDTLIVEGLSLHLGRGSPPLIDVLIYLDAAERDLEHWYADRFVGLWRDGSGQEDNFYARFASLDEAQVRAFAVQVWRAINIPNLREHIAAAREIADIVIAKGADHEIASVTVRDRTA